MAQSIIPVRFSDELREVAEILFQRRQYRNVSDYLRSLVRYDGIVGGDEHAVTKPIADKSVDHQIRIDAELLKWVKDGKRGRGVLLEKLIQRALESGAESGEDIKRRIADNL